MIVENQIYLERGTNPLSLFNRFKICRVSKCGSNVLITFISLGRLQYFQHRKWTNTNPNHMLFAKFKKKYKLFRISLK